MKRRTFLSRSAMSFVAATIDRDAVASSSRTSIGPILDRALIWCADVVPVPRDVRSAGMPVTDTLGAEFLRTIGEVADLHAAFVKEFALEGMPQTALVHLFAFTRYRLYVNGSYVGRGPARYQNVSPEYDSWSVAAMLKPGRNVIAILAHRDAPSGRIMYHTPGMAAVLAYHNADGVEKRIVTDATWRARPERSFGPRDSAWSSIPEHIDARRSDDWTAAGYDARAWPSAVKTADIGAVELQPRSIPLMRETALPWKAAALPTRLRPGDSLDLDLHRVSLAYHRLTLDAIAGSEIEVSYHLPENNVSGMNRYVARDGQQIYEGGDTFACTFIRVRLKSGGVTVTDAKAFEVLYPFDCVGRFDCDDPFLNQLWALCARSLQLMSEDAYTDCADRERVEWMDSSPPAFDVTQATMAAPDGAGGTRYGDPRLLRSLLRRTALTALADGQIKAHTCSERWDIHAIMEDRSCDWVIGLRQYFEASGDIAFVRSMWPTVVGLMAWFHARLTPRGLVLGREWEVWGNPLCYQVCEGAGLNAFVYHALIDAEWLGRRIGRTDQAAVFAARAIALRRAFNDLLWDEEQGVYIGALFGPGSKRATTFGKGIADVDITDGRFRPTLQAALFAFDAGIVPPDRAARLDEWILAHDDNVAGVMTHHYLFKRYYALDRHDLDTEVLKRMRSGWRNMVGSPWGTSWETLDGGGASKVHVYGIMPGHYLSNYVLGVRSAGSTAESTLLIDPRPGDLTRAQGVVSTAFGPVPIRWERSLDGAMDLSLTVPHGAKALVRLRPTLISTSVELNGLLTATTSSGNRLELILDAGAHRVRQISPSDENPSHAIRKSGMTLD